MDKLIDDIIELILGDMDCHHEVDHDEDGTHTSVEYNLNNETKLRGMIRELIQKPEVTEEWIGKKAIKLQETTVFLETESNRLKFSISWEKAKDFICSLVEAIPAKKATVDKEFVEKMVEESVYILHQDKHIFFQRKLKEAGVEVKK